MSFDYWRIDTRASRLRFSVRHLVFSRTEGCFRRFGGALGFDLAAPEGARVEARIEAASIDTGDRMRDEELGKLLEVQTYPELGFRSLSVQPRSARRYVLVGELRVRAVRREVSLAVEDLGRSQDGSRAHFRATTALDRRDFELRWNRIIEAGGVLVGDRIDVELDIHAERVADRQSAGFSDPA